MSQLLKISHSNHKFNNNTLTRLFSTLEKQEIIKMKLEFGLFSFVLAGSEPHSDGVMDKGE